MEVWYLKRPAQDGIKRRMALFIQNFISNRTFKVSITHTEVPQSSILSMTLSILSIIKTVNKGIEKCLYVGYFLIPYSSPNLASFERYICVSVFKQDRKMDCVSTKQKLCISEKKNELTTSI